MNANESDTNLFSPNTGHVLVGYVLVTIWSAFVGLVIGWLIWAR